MFCKMQLVPRIKIKINVSDSKLEGIVEAKAMPD